MSNKQPLNLYTNDTSFKFQFYPESFDADVELLKTKPGKIKVTLSFECDDNPDVQSDTIKLLKYQGSLLQQAAKAIREEAAKIKGEENVIAWSDAVKVAKRKADFDRLCELNEEYPES